MRTLIRVIAIMAVLHVLAAATGLAWLKTTDRLSRERILAVRETFTPTLAEEHEQRKQLEAMQAGANAQAERLGSLRGAGAGPETVAQRLEQERQKHELTLRQLERAREEVESLRRNLVLSQLRIEEQRKLMAEEKAALEKRLAEIEEEKNDAGFRKALALYEAMPPKQVKEMFVRMLDEGKADDVVKLLESMQPRKAGGVLKEFKAEEDIARAVELTERLRARGSGLTRHLEVSG